MCYNGGKEVIRMKIKMKNAAGQSYEVTQRNADTYFVRIDGNEFTISVTEDDAVSFDRFSEQKKRELTDAIFKEPSVLEQLDESALESDDELITNKEDFMHIINEVRNAK